MTRIGGVAAAEFAPLVRDVTGTDLASHEIASRFALAAWTTIAEPGDGDVGTLVRVLGAVDALRLVIDDAPSAHIAALLSERVGGEIAAERRRWTEAQKRWQPRVKLSTTLLALRQGGRYAMRFVVPGDEEWPVQLGDLGEHTPFALWVRGDVCKLSALERSVALVGARAATGYGEHVAVECSSGLVDRGYAVVSGGAYGIDGTAHRGALASKGITVAVLAGGLDRFYPAGHEQLIGRIVERGVVVAEVPPGTTPTKWRFLLRNRLIAALSSATVVVEAGWRSGSLNTANHAATLGRPLGAVPGPVTSSASAGCHRLLRENAAVCVTNAEEMAELAGASPTAPASERVADDSRPDPTGTRTRVLDALSKTTPRSIERIAELSGLGLDRVRAELGLLELDGLVRERQRGWLPNSPAT